MKKRSPIAVVLLPFVTFGIYSLYWFVKTKGEMTILGAKIPTSWLLIVPFVNIWWLWKYSEGVEHVTGEKLNGVLTFLLLWLLGFIGQAIVQDSFNNNVAVAAGDAAPTPVAEQSVDAPVSETPAESAPTVETPSEPATEASAEPSESTDQTPPAVPSA